MRFTLFTSANRVIATSTRNAFLPARRWTSSGAPAPAPATLGKQPILPPIEYPQANSRVQAVYDDMIKTFELKGPHQINNFWKVFANHVDAFENLWQRMKVVMADGELSAAEKERIYVAVSITNGCDYCVASHTASARKLGMSDGALAELINVVTMANETNRLAFAYRLNADQMYEKLYQKENAKKLAEM